LGQVLATAPGLAARGKLTQRLFALTPIAAVRMGLGLILFADALRAPNRPLVGEILTVLLGVALLMSGVAEALPRAWRFAAGILRIGALLGAGSCLVVLLAFLVQVQ
jgi:hypothetical protein